MSEPLRAAHPELPWRSMIGMRNRLIHDYGGVRLSVVWDVVANHLPDLVAAIEPLIPPEDAAGE